MSAKAKKKILKQIDALKDFPSRKTVQQLIKELQEKLRRIESKIEKGRQVMLPLSSAEIQRQANLSRASKLKKYHNYVRQIRNSFPDLTYSQIRKQFKERKQGKQTEIPDPVWFNPSP